jgi:Flp pilus assembly pilin Flp
MFPGSRLFILVIITVVMISVNVKLFRNVKL